MVLRPRNEDDAHSPTQKAQRRLRVSAPRRRSACEMHSFWQRLNAIFFYTLSVLGFLSFAAAGTTFWHRAEPRVSVSLNKILLRKIAGQGHDQAILTLAIDADLRSVFNWNVKQLFVYITAEYETEANTLNQVIVWDQIVSEPEHAWIRSSSVANKYSLTDQGYGLRGNNVTLAVNWNVVPSTGLLSLQHEYAAVHSFLMPEEYSTESSAKHQ